MRANHEEMKGTKKRPEKTFVPFFSSWLILRGGVFDVERSILARSGAPDLVDRRWV
jgi:hypothetical protein